VFSVVVTVTPNPVRDTEVFVAAYRVEVPPGCVFVLENRSIISGLSGQSVLLWWAYSTEKASPGFRRDQNEAILGEMRPMFSDELPGDHRVCEGSPFERGMVEWGSDRTKLGWVPDYALQAKLHQMYAFIPYKDHY
jgi:hypothetical protein